MLFSERHSCNGHVNLYTTLVSLKKVLGEFILFLTNKLIDQKIKLFPCQ